MSSYQSATYNDSSLGLIAIAKGPPPTLIVFMTERDSVSITEPLPLNFSFSQTNVSCNGKSDGQGSVIVTGGTLPYSYSWSNGDTDSLNTGLIFGTYILTVTDGLGCVLVDSIIITEPEVLALTSTDSDVLCFGGNTGFSTVHAVGGTVNYTYNWSPSGGSDSTALGLNRPLR